MPDKALPFGLRRPGSSDRTRSLERQPCAMRGWDIPVQTTPPVEQGGRRFVFGARVMTRGARRGCGAGPSRCRLGVKMEHAGGIHVPCTGMIERSSMIPSPRPPPRFFFTSSHLHRTHYTFPPFFILRLFTPRAKHLALRYRQENATLVSDWLRQDYELRGKKNGSCPKGLQHGHLLGTKT